MEWSFKACNFAQLQGLFTPLRLASGHQKTHLPPQRCPSGANRPVKTSDLDEEVSFDGALLQAGNLGVTLIAKSTFALPFRFIRLERLEGQSQTGETRFSIAWKLIYGMYRNPQNSNVVDDIYGHNFQFPSFSIYSMWVFLGIHSILGPFKLSVYNHFLKWSYPKIFKMNCVFHGKSQTKMDDNWGYSQRTPNFRLQNLTRNYPLDFTESRIIIIRQRFPKSWGYPQSRKILIGFSMKSSSYAGPFYLHGSPPNQLPSGKLT